MSRYSSILAIFLLTFTSPMSAEAAPKKKCTSSQELAILELDRRTLSLNKIYREQTLSLAINQELLTAANATNNLNESSRVGVIMTTLKQRIESTRKTIQQLSDQRSKILKSCKPKSTDVSASSKGIASTNVKCTTEQINQIQTLAEQYENTLLQIQSHELEIYRQRKLAKSYVSQGKNSQVAEANYEIQKRTVLAGDLSAYGNVIKRQFEIANSTCSNSNIQLSNLLSKIFVPNSLISMNINRIESVNKEVTRPIVTASSGNLSIACDNSSSNSSSHEKVGVYFAFTTKQPEIWDRYNGAGVDSDAFTKLEFQPNYLKQPDSTFTLRDFSGNALTFRGFKAETRSAGSRDICDFEIIPIIPANYATNAVGIWYFVIASSQSSTTIWSLSGFTLGNYLNPLKF